jgi:hypothetical protein
MSWSTKQYVAFEDERTRPVRDLLGALPDIQARTAIDLGCGPGNSTEVLAVRFPGAAVSGIDSSPLNGAPIRSTPCCGPAITAAPRAAAHGDPALAAARGCAHIRLD